MSDATHHSTLEDTQGILVGSAVTAMGVALLGHLGLVTGQTAGLALILAYGTGLDFGLVFFVLNLPFYWFAVRRIGWTFTVKTFIAVGLLSAFVEIHPFVIPYGAVHPAAGAVMAGVFAGIGLLALFRHGASLGGVGVLALWLQDRTGFRAGWTQMIVDAAVFALAFLVIEPVAVLWSLLGAVVLNALIAVNHRRDRYIAM